MATLQGNRLGKQKAPGTVFITEEALDTAGSLSSPLLVLPTRNGIWGLEPRVVNFKSQFCL